MVITKLVAELDLTSKSKQKVSKLLINVKLVKRL